jgi:hypothetical protein
MTASRQRRRQLLAALAALAMVGAAMAWRSDRDRDDAGAATPPAEEVTWTLRPYEGVGAWIDVYDWTDELTGGRPSVGLADIDRMAEAGVDTVFIQTAHNRSTAVGVIEQPRLEALIDRAHTLGLDVVAWYLPPLVDVDADLARLVASADLPVDGLAVDIEAREVADVAERNRRLLDLTARLRAEVGPDHALGAITPSPTHLQVVNPDFWPAFPWPEVGRTYDVILPMSYWSIRTGELQDGERHIGDDIARVRTSTGDPEVPIHAIGGIADDLTAADVAGMVRAIEARSGVGGSLYDWATSAPDQWEALAPLRSSAS